MKKATKKVLCFLLAALLLVPSDFVHANEQKAGNVEIDVTDFGADPSGTLDSAEAIWAAFEAAKEATENGADSVTVNFPTGEYHIYKDKAQKREYHTSNTNSIENPIKTIGILIENQENLTVEGNGSLFMMHGNMMALAVAHSENITLHDFSWDFAVPTVTEMTVTGKEGNYTDYYIPSCFPFEISGTSIRWSSDLSPYTGQPYWSGTNHDVAGQGTYAVVGYHPDDEMTRNYYPSDGPLSNVSRIEKLSDTAVRVYYSSRSGAQQSNQKVGTIFELCSNAHRQTAGAFTYESKNVTAEEVNVHFMHGFGWLIQMSENVYYRKCNLVPRENSGHITVSFADGIHASGAAGEIVIEDCNFANTHDDPINLHGTFTRVEALDQAANTLTLKYIHGQQGGFPQYHVGDKVQFFTRDTLESTDGEKMYTVSKIVQDTDESSDLRTMIIEFEEKLPANLADRIGSEGKYVAENVTYAPKVTITGCTFRNVPTRGILCTTRNKVLIENNIFYNMSMATIFLSNDSGDWYESGPIRDMTIKGNTFYIKDIGRTAWEYASAIYVHPVTKGGGLPDASNPIHKNITIEGNTFYMDLDTVVKAESVENLKFLNNKVFRMNPDVEITAALDNTTVAVGTQTNLTVNATGNTNDGTIDNVFEFTKSKDILIEGNTYDDGLKLYAVANDDATANSITIKDEDITLVRNRNQAAAAPVRDIRYTSTNPEVVSIDSTGTITAVKAGKAEVFAYYNWNDTIIRSNAIEVTVEGAAAADTVEIVNAENETLSVGTTKKFEVKDNKEVTWSVLDFETEGNTDKATIAADGTLTAVKEGVVWVKASTASASDKVAVVISGGGTYGLNPAFSITRDQRNYSYDADSISIEAQNGSDLWQWDNTLKNLFLYEPTVAKDNLRTSVKVENLPVRESNKWDTVSFILYSGDDDYYTIGKKSHYDGFASVKERAQQAQEEKGSSEHDAVSTAWLGMSKVGKDITLEYSLDGTTWNILRKFEDDTFGNTYKIGFGTWGSERTAVFSEFKVGTADQSYDQLSKVSITKSTNTAPTAAELALAVEGTTVTATYKFADADNDTQGTSYYRWTYELDGTEVTRVTTTNTFSVAGVEEVSCQVYPVDSYGTPGAPSAVKTVQIGAEDTLDLYSVSFNGDCVYERNGAIEATVVIPAEAKKAEISYVSVNNGKGSIEIKKNGQTVEGTFKNTDSFVLELADGDVITIKRGETTYTFNVKVVESNDTTVEKIVMDTLDFEVTPTDEKAFYANADSAQKTGTLAVTVSEEVGSVEIRKGDLRKVLETTKAGTTYSAAYELVNGVNSFYVKVLAKDGVTEKEYIVNVNYTPSSDITVTDIKLNGAIVEGFAANVYEYFYELDTDKEELTVAVGTTQDVKIALNGEVADAKEATFNSLEDGVNTLVIAVTAEDGITKAQYTVEVVKPYDTNVNLAEVTLNNADITAELMGDEAACQKYVASDEVTFVVKPQDSRATVKVMLGDKEVTTNTFNVYKDLNDITIQVTAADGKTTKTYSVDLEKAVYLSDLGWDTNKSTCGWDVLRADLSNAGTAIQLADENGKPVTFEKGIGAHADSDIYFNIENGGYARLTGFVGIDYGKYNGPYADVQFKILIDGEQVFDSGVMAYNTPMKAFDVEIPADAKELKLQALMYDENNWDDHADWADAKLIASFGEQPEEECKHETTKVVDAKDATCTAEGYTGDTVCAVCGDLVTKGTVIAKLAHTEVVVEGKAATCTETGLTEGKKCSACGTVTVEQKVIDKKAHTEVVVEGKAATCTETGLTEGKKCSVCGTVTVVQKEIAAKGHTFGAWTVVKEATAEAEGLEKRVCACGKEETRVIEKLPEVPEVVDKTALEGYIEACEEYYEEADYTAESWAVYAAALADAKQVLANEDATKEDVAAAVAALADAAEALAEVEPEQPVDPEKPGTDDKEEDKSPATGDNAMVLPMVVLMAACAVIVAILRKRLAK